jgi:glutaredoxin-like protein NrdH
VKEFLSRAGRSFTVRLVDEDDSAFEALLETGYRSVPVTVIGKTIVPGFDSDAIAKALEDAG